MAKRIKFIDIARGLAIILIVFGHSIAYSEHCTLIEKYIYSFHVVLFFIISGYILKIDENTNFFNFLKNKFFRILIPYFIWSTMFLIPYMVIGEGLSSEIGTMGTFDWLTQIKYIIYGNGNGLALKQNTPLWFLPALFSMEIIYYFIIKMINNKSAKSKFLICIPILIIAYLSNTYLKIILPFGIKTVLDFGIFLYYGYLAKTFDLFSKKYLFKIPILLILFIIGSLAGLYNIKVAVANYNYGLFSLALVSGFCLSTIIVFIAYLIKENNILEFIGKKSMDILIFHKITIVIFQFKLGFISKLLKSSNLLIEFLLSALICFISILISILISNIFNYLIGLIKNKKGEM